MSNNSKFIDLVEKFSELKIAVIGDLMLDEYTWGSVDRVSPEAPVLVVKVEKENFRAGGAGNVAANLVGLGAEVKLISAIGDDREASLIKEVLKRSNVSSDFLISSSEISTTTKNRVLAHNQQVVRVDRESSSLYSKDLKENIIQKVKSSIKDVDAVLISDYGKGVFSKDISESLFNLLKNGKTIPVIVDPKPQNFKLYSGATVITPNRLEAERITGLKIDSIADAEKASKIIFSKINLEQILITLGSQGMALFSKEEGLVGHIDTVAQKVFDVSGAGDTVCSLLALGMSAGESSTLSAELSNIAAGIVVGEVGTVPISKEKLIHYLDLNSDESSASLKIANS